MITDLKGDLLRDDAQALVNPVNCAGVMGKGLALKFKFAYPGLFNAYRAACQEGRLTPGVVFAFSIDGTERYVLNFPTKRHWRQPSRVKDIESGLVALSEAVIRLRIASVAVPALGCGLGGLGWSVVRPMIAHHLGALEADVRLYAPDG